MIGFKINERCLGTVAYDALTPQPKIPKHR